jgi:hypothetical protein
MDSIPLEFTENIEEGRLANERGELSDRQRTYLLREIAFRSKPPLFWSPVPDLWVFPLSIPLSGFVILLATRQLNWIPAWLALSALLVAFYLFTAVRGRWRFTRQERPRLDSARHRLQHDDYWLESWEGPVSFVIRPEAQWMTQYTVDRYLIETPLHSFPVSKALWEQLRPQAEGDFTLHYLTEPLVTLLSIEPISLYEPPTDAELATVVGIGDDGELIYEEQGKTASQL